MFEINSIQKFYKKIFYSASNGTWEEIMFTQLWRSMSDRKVLHGVQQGTTTNKERRDLISMASTIWNYRECGAFVCIQLNLADPHLISHNHVLKLYRIQAQVFPV